MRFCPVALLLATQDRKSNPRLPWIGHTAQSPCLLSPSTAWAASPPQAMFNMSTNAASHRMFLVGNGQAESEKPPGSVAGWLLR
jgi:hypothetical protein